mmetsp:Transcript_23806/g.26413  ORF Transcript_23806/g.26413 Transcript_23806/m.26413 type:complete len:122 (-) Transcript_23806:150-515(-)
MSHKAKSTCPFTTRFRATPSRVTRKNKRSTQKPVKRCLIFTTNRQGKYQMEHYNIVWNINEAYAKQPDAFVILEFLPSDTTTKPPMACGGSKIQNKSVVVIQSKKSAFRSISNAIKAKKCT